MFRDNGFSRFTQRGVPVENDIARAAERVESAIAIARAIRWIIVVFLPRWFCYVGVRLGLDGRFAKHEREPASTEIAQPHAPTKEDRVGGAN